MRVHLAMASLWGGRSVLRGNGWAFRGHQLPRARLFYKSRCARHGVGGPGLPRAAAALQGSLFAGQRGDPPQVFPDFDKLRRVLFLLLRGFFQLKERDTAA